ncbi:MAG: SDR family oxidoreductase [Chloroflexi bacterium]|nr:SDR family oxidoreductase [Chloroflexota bacterium]MBP8058142.1 SDR family oxidoreductase [Chloroflexota bacterium]
MSRILITGGSSYLGQHLVPLAMAEHEVSYTFYNRDPLNLPQGRYVDMRDAQAVKKVVADFAPEAIIHTAGSNRSPNMHQVIVEGAENIRAAAYFTNARLIHISTDVIFDGKNAPYKEGDPPTPIHTYGRAKAASEAIIRRHHSYAIIRTSLIYGLKLMDMGTQWMVNALRSGDPVTLFKDQIRNPVWANTLCQACLELAHSQFVGVINVAGRQTMSRAEFGLKLLNWWGIFDRATLAIGTSDPEQFPQDCRLDLTLAEKVLTTPLIGVDELLAQVSL